MCIVGRWEGERYVIENYFTGSQLEASPSLLMLLDRIRDYLPRTTILEIFSLVPRRAFVVNQLLRYDVLVEKDCSLAAAEEAVCSAMWDTPTRAYHFASQRIRFQSLHQEGKALQRLVDLSDPPSPFLNLRSKGIPVSGAFDLSMPLTEALHQRRSQRTFTGQAMTFPQLSSLLNLTWGATARLKDPVLGHYILKTSPSGGSRHPTEVYVAAERVEGLQPGLYHYSVERNELELLRRGRHKRDILKMCASQRWVSDAAAVFIMTSRFDRTEWKYKHPHAYRVLHLECGHLGQTFQLLATALHLGSFCSAAMDFDRCSSILSLDPIREFPIYFCAAGHSTSGPP